MQDESGEQFVAYFLPTESTLDKRRLDATEGRPYEEDFEYEYMMAREYNWTVKSKASKGYEENYFLVIRSDGAYFNELETRLGDFELFETSRFYYVMYHCIILESSHC